MDEPSGTMWVWTVTYEFGEKDSDLDKTLGDHPTVELTAVAAMVQTAVVATRGPFDTWCRERDLRAGDCVKVERGPMVDGFDT